jgi:hypothetical protein
VHAELADRALPRSQSPTRIHAEKSESDAKELAGGIHAGLARLN